MADVLVVCGREENKDDFIVELIKGLISRGLIVSYAGAFYSERKDHYIYDNVTNLQFFISTYFREAQMKNKDFKTWEEFLANIDFEQIDARLIIYVITCTRRMEVERLREDFRNSSFLETLFAKVAVEVIRDSFEMSFSDFESHYPELSNILNMDKESLDKLKDRVRNGLVGANIMWGDNEPFHRVVGTRIGWGADDLFQIFIRKVLQRERELREESPSEETLCELEKYQEVIELECLSDPSKGEQLILDFFGSNVIEETLSLAERNEIVFYYDIKKRTSQKNILCLYCEEETGGKKANLYPYSEKSFKEKSEKDDKNKKDELKSKNKASRKIPRPHPYISPKIKRDKIELDPPRKLYEPTTIRDIIDDHVMLALHPRLVHIYFPVNDSLLEVDPEEPEIGFLSREIDLRNCKTIEERLKIDMKLRKKLLIYKLKEKKKEKRLHQVNIGDKKENQKEKIAIFGRTEDIYKVFISNKKHGSRYQLIHSLLKFLTPLVVMLLLLYIILNYSSNSLAAKKTFVELVFTLIGITFAFWASKSFVLNYILDPIYRTLRYISYSILSVALVLGTGNLTIFSLLLLITCFVAAFYFFKNYIFSAMFYQLNNLLGIVGYSDIVETEDSNVQNDVGKVICLECEQFQTIVRIRNDVEALFNSNLFPMIKCVHKRARTVPKKLAYSSGIFLSPKGGEESEKTTKDKPLMDSTIKMLYKKPEAWKFWRKLELFLFGKGMIEPKGDLNDGYSPNTRYIYSGQWNHVMKHIRNTIPVFPQTVLFRNMLILAALSGLLYNAFQEHIPDEKNITFLNIILYLVILLIVILLTRKLKPQLWRILIFLSFCLLILLQPTIIKILISVIILVFLCLAKFLICQIWYSLRIWLNEVRRGTITSVENGRGERGIRIQRNILVTRLFMMHSCIEDERIYYNKRFYKDFIESDEWEKIRKE